VKRRLRRGVKAIASRLDGKRIPEIKLGIEHRQKL
jgi:hypothetical protein